MPEAVDGMCSAGEAVVLFGVAGEAQDHARCFSGFRAQSPTILTFFYCINYDCLPHSLQNKTLDVTAERVLIPGGPTNFEGNKTATLVTFLVPSCIQPSATAYKYNIDNELTDLPSEPGQNGVFKYPTEGIAALSLHARVEPKCNDDFVAGLVTSAYVQEDQPPIPTSSCPCWSTPQDAMEPNELGCDGIKVPVTLETIPNWRFNDGVSYRQCIDPANFDFFTGRMAFSYCWRYHCLPSEFARSQFTATITGVQRHNVRRMPGGVVYNTTLQATPGVRIEVVGNPKDSNASLVEFSHSNNHGGITYMGGDWVTMNITLPEQGLESLDFKYTIPVGFDDLGAAVIMDLRDDQEIPAQPPAPPGTICRCPDLPVDGQCAGSNTVLATYSRLDSNSSITTQRCLVKPTYNLFTKSLWFSTCWRWACLDPAFRGENSNKIKPYRIRLQNMPALNLELMPGGQARMELLKPPDVVISLTANSDGALSEGPYDESGYIMLPGSVSNMDITIDVPPYPWYDNNNAAIVVTPGPFPPSPPPSPISPPLPPAPPRDPAATTKVIATFTVLLDIRSASELEAYLARKAADIEAGIEGFTINQLLGFLDFSKVEDCSQEALQSFTAHLALILGVEPTKLSVDCNFAGSTENLARRSLLFERALLQAPLCPGQKLNIGLQRFYSLESVADIGTVDSQVTESKNKLVESLGEATCIGPEQRFTRIRLSQTRSAALSLEQQCAELRRSLNVRDGDAIFPGCEEQQDELLPAEPAQEDSEQEQSNPISEIVSASSPSSSSNTRPLAIGLGVGLGGAAVLSLVIFAVYKTKHAGNATVAKAIGAYESKRAVAYAQEPVARANIARSARTAPTAQQPQSTAARFMQMNQTYWSPRGVTEGSARPGTEASIGNVERMRMFVGKRASPAPVEVSTDHPHPSFTLPGSLPSRSVPTEYGESPRSDSDYSPSSRSVASIAPPSLVMRELRETRDDNSA